jgi:hypothetical protein
LTSSLLRYGASNRHCILCTYFWACAFQRALALFFSRRPVLPLQGRKCKIVQQFVHGASRFAVEFSRSIQAIRDFSLDHVGFRRRRICLRVLTCLIKSSIRRKTMSSRRSFKPSCIQKRSDIRSLKNEHSRGCAAISPLEPLGVYGHSHQSPSQPRHWNCWLQLIAYRRRGPRGS